MQCTRNDFKLDNGSGILMVDLEHTPCKFRGKTLSALIIDDLEIYDEEEWCDFYTAVYPSVSGANNDMIFASHKKNPISENFKENIFTIENIS